MLSAPLFRRPHCYRCFSVPAAIAFVPFFGASGPPSRPPERGGALAFAPPPKKKCARLLVPRHRGGAFLCAPPLASRGRSPLFFAPLDGGGVPLSSRGARGRLPICVSPRRRGGARLVLYCAPPPDRASECHRVSGRPYSEARPGVRAGLVGLDGRVSRIRVSCLRLRAKSKAKRRKLKGSAPIV